MMGWLVSDPEVYIRISKIFDGNKLNGSFDNQTCGPTAHVRANVKVTVCKKCLLKFY